MTLVIAFPYDAATFGGSHISSLIMARALKQRGHRPIVVTHGEGRVLAEAREAGLETAVLRPLDSARPGARPGAAGIQHLTAGPSAANWLRSSEAALVHVNDLSMLRAWALPSLMCGRTLIAHWRSNYAKSVSVDAALRLAQCVISVSDYSREALPHWAQAKTVVEFNALPKVWSDDERMQARVRTRERLGLAADAHLLGVFGNFAARKRTFMLADILAHMPAASDGRPIFGLACGAPHDPPDELFPRRIAEHGLESRVFLPGFVRPVEDWMAACDIILAPAEREPLARNVLEARAVGVPAIASADGGLKELIRHGEDGLILPHDQLDDWLSAIDELLTDAAASRALAGRASEQARSMTPDRHAERIEAIYQRALRDPQRVDH